MKTTARAILTQTPLQALVLKEQWPEAVVLWIRDWVAQTYSGPLKLASQAQEHALWKQAIQRAQAFTDTINLRKIAEMAQEAWETIQLSYPNPAPTLASLDQHSFKTITEHFQALLRTHQLTDYACALRTLIEQKQPCTIIGYEYLPPLLKTWAQPFKVPAVKPTIKTHTAYVDETHEHQAMAEFAKNHLGTVIYLIPAIAKYASSIQRTFMRTLKDRSDFQIMHASTLNQHPLVKSALTGLKLLNDRLTPAEFTQFLHSPFFEHATDPATFHYDQKQRDEPNTYYTTKLKLQPGTILQRNIDAARAISEYVPAPVSTWATRYRTQLQTLGFLKNIDLIPEEQKIKLAFEKALLDFASLSGFLGELSAETALQELLNTLEITATFPTPKKIMMMEPVEALGLSPDAFWFGKTNTWRDQIKQNIFLPKQILKNTPLKHMANQLMSHAPIIQCSFPQTVNEEPQHADTIVFPKITDTLTQNTFKHPFTTKPQYCSYEDEIVPLTTMAIKGGSGFFKDQSACAFRGFARHRLNAKALRPYSRYTNPMLRGILTHTLLELFWKDIETQAALIALTAEELDTKLDTLISTTLDHYNFPKTRFRDLEHQRFKELLTEWLNYEKTRPPFTVQATEESHDREWNGLKFKTQIDRIDTVYDAQGQSHALLIDYKTGPVSPMQWYGERPDDPQLPLYAVTSKQPIDAIAYARIAAPTFKLQGLTRIPELCSGLRTAPKTAEANADIAWDALLQEWQTNLEILAHEIRAGQAAINPKDGDLTCRTCDLSTLCRIMEKEL